MGENAVPFSMLRKVVPSTSKYTVGLKYGHNRGHYEKSEKVKFFLSHHIS